MTRTAVRRHVDVSDGRLVIRKIVVEAPVAYPDASATDQDAPVMSEREPQRRANRLRSLNPGRYAMRARER